MRDLQIVCIQHYSFCTFALKAVIENLKKRIWRTWRISSCLLETYTVHVVIRRAKAARREHPQGIRIYSIRFRALGTVFTAAAQPIKRRGCATS